jgi:hypothetical protein
MVQKMTTYATYRVLCANGAERHRLTMRTVRAVAIAARDKYDAVQSVEREEEDPFTSRRACGPHVIQQALVTVADWEPMDENEPDPQMTARASVLTEAARVVCPTCEVDVGEPCVNLRTRKARRVEVIKWPHTERLALAAKRLGMAEQ